MKVQLERNPDLIEVRERFNAELQKQEMLRARLRQIEAELNDNLLRTQTRRASERSLGTGMSEPINLTRRQVAFLSAIFVAWVATIIVRIANELMH